MGRGTGDVPFHACACVCVYASVREWKSTPKHPMTFQAVPGKLLSEQTYARNKPRTLKVFQTLYMCGIAWFAQKRKHHTARADTDANGDVATHVATTIV